MNFEIYSLDTPRSQRITTSQPKGLICLKYDLKVLLLGILCGVCIAPIQAQGLDSLNTGKMRREADTYFRNREYMAAIKLYQKILKIDSTQLRDYYHLGLATLKSANSRQALRPLQLVAARQPQYHELLPYYLAEAYKYNNQIDSATKYYQQVKAIFASQSPKKTVQIVNDEITVKDFIPLIEQRLRECKFGIKYLTDPTVAKVKNMGAVINSPYADYAPVINAEETKLIFTSRRPQNRRQRRDYGDQAAYEDLYEAQKKRGEWQKPKDISELNSKYHEASIALSPDGKQLFLYQDENNGDIFRSELGKRDQWGRPQRVGGEVNTRYREPSASISADGKTLYFASDRPGGFGGLDIYKCEQDERGNWGKAVNLGAVINTPEDEDCPFIHQDQHTLYFSSRGHESIGGYDIFYSESINGEWTKPVNLGFPINTTHDDIHFVLSANYKRGYYASDQNEGYGDKDIYIVEMPDYQDVEVIDFQLSLKTLSIGFQPLITQETRRAVVILRGSVRDEMSDELLSAKMTLVDVDENQAIEEINAVAPRGVYVTTMTTGHRYLLHVQREGYMYHAEYFEIPAGVVSQEKVLNIYLKRITPKSALDFKALFDYNSAELKPMSFAALDKLFDFLMINPQLKGEIAGHTDNIGSATRNKVLSEARAKAVFDYLLKKGIKPERLSYAGYGPDQPLMTNETPYGRSMNRRTEFRILSVN